MGLVQETANSTSHPIIDDNYDLETDPLVRKDDIAEVEDFLLSFPDLTKEYIPIAVIGEGTFSTVFKAIDVNHWYRDNGSWSKFSRQHPDDPSKILTYFTRMAQVPQTRSTKRALSSPVNQAIRHFVMSQYTTLDPGMDEVDSVDLADIKARFEQYPPQCVAIKRITGTSGPQRIGNEMKYLLSVGGAHNVVPLITALRFEDQILLVFPYFLGEDFREFMLTASSADIADYMRLLLEALAHLKNHNLIHRDVKPSNFLFARRQGDRPAAALLVDFGLAQFESPQLAAGLEACNIKQLPSRKLECIARLRKTLSVKPPGYLTNDPRTQMRAMRAGTRGFRAPEVLFKSSFQSCSIDVWSAGVILLTLLTRRYPFFQSNDDLDAIVEIAAIYGSVELEKAAKAYHRAWKSNIGSIPSEHLTFKRLVRRFSPSTYASLPDDVFDLLNSLLRLVVTERISAQEALEHPFIISNS